MQTAHRRDNAPPTKTEAPRARLPTTPQGLGNPPASGRQAQYQFAAAACCAHSSRLKPPQSTKLPNREETPPSVPSLLEDIKDFGRRLAYSEALECCVEEPKPIRRRDALSPSNP